MRQIGIRELRDTLTKTLRRVRAGETIEITHDGVPVALLSPIPRDRLGRLYAAGDVHPPSVTGQPWPLLAQTGPMTASEALERDRDDR